ncbi:MAG: dTDP-4-dehydrorhamnose reductase [Nitrospiraceae bacterium]|nr:dTDP-4-dehydrorhamnose reductase [Nitrospiraceae bacterium]
MRIALTGAQGQLGHELQRVLAKHELIPLDLPAFDLTKPDCADAMLDAAPEIIVHAGAYTDVDGAERNPELAMAINASGTERVTRAAEQVGARMIYISTDYVFDGRAHRPYVEKDAPNPVSVYGASKRAGEERVLGMCRNALVVRTAWLYGSHGKNFVKTILQLASERPVLKVVADQRGCPTFAGDLAAVIGQLLDRPVTGILHVANSGSCTWREFAAAIVSLSGRSVPVEPITTAEAGRLARRPAYSVLASDRHLELGLRMPTWEDALKRFLQPVSVGVSAS